MSVLRFQANALLRASLTQEADRVFARSAQLAGFASREPLSFGMRFCSHFLKALCVIQGPMRYRPPSETLVKPDTRHSGIHTQRLPRRRGFLMPVWQKRARGLYLAYAGFTHRLP